MSTPPEAAVGRAGRRRHQRPRPPTGAAAANAAGTYANRVAERLLDRALGAAARAGDPALEAGARLDRGRVLVALGSYQAAFADQERALELAVEHGLEELEAAALEQLGWTAYYHRDSQAASDLRPQAQELAGLQAFAGAGPIGAAAAARMRRQGDSAGARAASTPSSASPTRPPRQPARPTWGCSWSTATGSPRPARCSTTASTPAGPRGCSGPCSPPASRSRWPAPTWATCGVRSTGSPCWSACWPRSRTASTTPGRPPPAPGSGATGATRGPGPADQAVDLLGPATTGTHPGSTPAALADRPGGRGRRRGRRPAGAGRRALTGRWLAGGSSCATPAGQPPDPPAADGLLQQARAYGSTKYQALALARLGRRPEAAELAATSGSDYLLAQVAPPAQARAATDRIAAGLPPELRPGFLEKGYLARTVSGT
jgi:hypothetical protein